MPLVAVIQNDLEVANAGGHCQSSTDAVLADGIHMVRFGQYVIPRSERSITSTWILGNAIGQMYA